MDDINLEQIIKVRQPQIAYFYKAGMIALSVFSIVLMQFAGVAFGVIFTACFVVFAVLLFRYYDAEYEYELVGNMLSVDRIMSKSARRHCGDYDIAGMEIMAPLGSERIAYKEHNKYKSFDYSSNTGKEGVYVMYLPCDGELVRVLLEPDERILKAVKSIARGKVYDE